ncbi:hypothetical protein B0T17DRAFT_651002 [Bombardia bombarda]|uniref:Uncharacterized protein n=1 Tax=Bombardia bombarda TaxID=252184 RepID=A0AA40CF27_9PEZI|nr:hypothetical protein B0T17DRAFT_651002 [Bombardia bombarda]
MVAAREWSASTTQRKPLRVSESPRGLQRESYFLHLPYRLGVPLVVFSILIHWLMSQSIFVVAVEKVQASEKTNGWVIITCGYSPIAIVFVLALCCVLVLALAVSARRRLLSAMPVAGSCSLVIAAACHDTEGLPQPDSVLLPLQWGVIPSNQNTRPDDGNSMGYCGFSAEKVGQLDPGMVYS